MLCSLRHSQRRASFSSPFCRTTHLNGYPNSLLVYEIKHSESPVLGLSVSVWCISRYITSCSMKTLDDSKMLQLAMNGPNVNWFILSELRKQREEKEIPIIEDIGSCELHVVSGAFQSGMKATEWDLDKILRAMWKILDKSPSRRGEFLKVPSSPQSFPLKFCVSMG